MAQVRPFRAVRYDERRAGPLASLVAPPYDVLDAEARARYLAASPHNVVHLTLADGEAEAARLWSAWLGDGTLVREEDPACWWLAQEYTGPDGVTRTREGLVCSLRAEPYEAGVVLPHERTHAGPKEGRLRLLRALRAHVEPIFLLYDGRLERPDGESVVEVELEGVRSRLWRLEGDPPGVLADAQLLIADGHHRYETTLAYHAEEGTEESAWLLVAIVPTEQEGLTIFPTHRIATRLEPVAAERPFDGELPRDRSAAVIYRTSGTTVVDGGFWRAGHGSRRPAGARRSHVHAIRGRGEGGRGLRCRRGCRPGATAERRARPGAGRARRDHASEEHVLLSQASQRLALSPSVTDWLKLCRAATAEVQAVLAELPTRDEREVVVGSGEGGDDTTAIDAAAEGAVVSLLDSSGVDFALVSEELGHRAARAEGAVTVVLDPIDGSINAKRGIPFFSLSIAVADGPTMADVMFGYVHDFGSGEEWSAVRGEGASLNGAPLDGPLPKETIELLGLEATKTVLVAKHAQSLVEIAERLRDDGLAGALPLPSRCGTGGRSGLAAPRAVGRHRGRAAARPGARARRRAVRRPAALGRAARPRAALAPRRRRRPPRPAPSSQPRCAEYD